MNAQFPDSGGFSLVTVGLRVESDLVRVRRLARSAGEEFGLDERDSRSLSAASYEVARALHQVAAGEPIDVEIRLAEGPSLQVVFRAIGDPDLRERFRVHIEPVIAGLRPLVDHLDVEERDDVLAICLRSLFPTGAARRLTAWAARPSTDLPLSPDSIPQEELRQRYGELDTAFRELQSELQETNRGVVALYAELEGQADKLRQAEDRLRLLLDSVTDYAICMLTATGEIASWNSGAERLFGYSSDEVIGRHFSLFYPVDEREAGTPDEDLRQTEERGRLAAERVRMRHGGIPFDAHVDLTAVRAGRDRELRGFSLVVRDITERKRLEDDLRHRAEALAAANRAKEDFLATLSHELRTPLNAMLGWTRLLRMGKLDEDAITRALATIERNARIQEQLIADILDISRIVTGKLRVDLRPIELAPVIEGALDAVRPALEAKRIDLTTHVDFTGTVLGDPDRLQQVVWNLLVNGIKFTPAGGSLAVSLHASGASAVITVTDTGEGIAPDLLPVIFDRFTQGDASVTRPHGGLGLGLSIVRHIVELHGGKVHAASEGKGQGSSFAVYLPVRAVQHVPVSEEPSEEDDSGQPLNGVKVLVVDDDEDARKVVAMALSQCGAHTTAAASAREAMQKLTEFRFDVLVSDIAMPGEDGYSLIRRVRALRAEGIGDVPAVALTAFCQPEDRRRALTAGFQQFVPKPVELDELAEVVRTLAVRRTA